MTDASPADFTNRAFSEAVLDSVVSDLRKTYCRSAAETLIAISTWLAIDSSLDQSGLRSNWRSSAAVLEMAAELAQSSVSLLDLGLAYGAAAVIRQLIETEYLLKTFFTDFDQAAIWIGSSPADIRKRFTPVSLRKQGQFSDSEYWSHCDNGGHPAPQGVRFLRFYFSGSDYIFESEALWADLALHVKRVWEAANALLSTRHIRYSAVHSGRISDLNELEHAWLAKETLTPARIDAFTKAFKNQNT